MLNSLNSKSVVGKVHPGKATSKINGGYIVESSGLPNGRGFMPDSNDIKLGKDILVKIVGGVHNGMPILHPVFGGFR